MGDTHPVGPARRHPGQERRRRVGAQGLQPGAGAGDVVLGHLAVGRRHVTLHRVDRSGGLHRGLEHSARRDAKDDVAGGEAHALKEGDDGGEELGLGLSVLCFLLLSSRFLL